MKKTINIEALIGYTLWFLMGIILMLKVVGIDLWL
jgi:hypothetical protein